MPDGADYTIQVTPKPDSVRIAGPDDEAALFDIFCAAHADNGFMSMDRDKVAEWVHFFTCHPDGAPHCVAGVIDGDDGRIIGCAGLLLLQPWSSSDWMIEDRLVFVRPENRSAKHARDLLLFCRWYADTLKLPMLVGVLSMKKAQLKSRFFDRYLPRQGAYFFYNGGQS